MRARWPLAALAVLLAAWPWLAPRYFVFLASLILVNAIVALGLNILSGYTNQLSFGHAGFLAIGAYTAALLALHVPGLPVPASLALAGLVTAAVGLAFGVPCLRLHGLYLTMATLAFGVVITEAILNLDGLTRGADGLRVPAAHLGPWALASDASRYYLVVSVASLMTAAAVNLTRTRTGRAFLAIRESEIAAEASGVPERELVGEPGQEIQPDGHHGVDQDEARQEHEVARRHPRPDDQRHREGRHRGPRPHTLRRSTRPSSPAGRTSRMAMSTRNGTE